MNTLPQLSHLYTGDNNSSPHLSQWVLGLKKGPSMVPDTVSVQPVTVGL